MIDGWNDRQKERKEESGVLVKNTMCMKRKEDRDR